VVLSRTHTIQVDNARNVLCTCCVTRYNTVQPIGVGGMGGGGGGGWGGGGVVIRKAHRINKRKNSEQMSSSLIIWLFYSLYIK